jgi:hypothetical protein
LEDIRRYVCHGVPQEEDGWEREEKELAMRCKEEEDDAKSRKRRAGMAMWEPHALRCQEELTGAAARDAREFGTRGAWGGNDDAGIQNTIKNTIQCQDFPLTY